MAIEVTSVPDRDAPYFPHYILSTIKNIGQAFTFGQYRLFLQVFIGLLIVAVLAAGHTLFRSYQYYSRIIDNRLACGYLTSRAGLYAARTTLRPGQGLSAPDLVSKLQRAGYVEGSTNDVWNGSFTQHVDCVEIHPTLTHEQTNSAPVVVTFDSSGRIKGLTQDDISLESFTLEPEVLTNDASTKVGEHRALTFDQLPPDLVHAILAIEDRRFFQHPGLDPFGIARALLRNAGEDRLGQGGSTITQQLVKNTYLSPERTLRRKYAEAMLAFALERRLSKQDIFALYCNEIYFGERGAVAVRGIYQAAKIYFGKDPARLTLAEAATLAGMIQGPSRYSPVRHADATRERRNRVLEMMAHEQWITEDQAKTAESEQVSVIPNQNVSSLAPYFVDFVNRVETNPEISGEEHSVVTTIDLDLQRIAEVTLERQLTCLDRRKENAGKKLEGAIVALDPHTGDVLAMVGGRDYATSQLNRVTDAHRQPGSTFKPFVYAAALEDGISPLQMFADAPQEFVYDGNRIYKPMNFAGRYSMREVPMRTGLVQSLNTVTVALAMQTGLARIANLTEKFGLPKPPRYPALALGTTEVTPLELACAYATFVNGGRRIQPRTTTVTDSSGVALSDTRAVQVISPTTAYMITNILSAVVDHGTGRQARNTVKGTALAGKTGTSRDAWFVGYTPNLVCVVWIGFDDNTQLGMTGTEAALPAWAEFMQASINRRPELGGTNFDCPEGIKFVEIDDDTGLISTLTCPNRELIAVTDRLAPHMECYFHGNLPRPYQEDDDVRTNSPGKKPKLTVTSFDTVNIAKSFVRTRIEVDNTGRRTLVNDMR